MKWFEPKFFLLTRGRSEESVLEVCKNHDGSYTMVDNQYCGWKDGQGVCQGVTGT